MDASTSRSATQVLIDIDGEQAKFALGYPDRGIDVTTLRQYRTTDFPTATDCVQRFAQDTGVTLSGKHCAISVSGAVHGDSIRIARCPWIISARGFGYLFQNDVKVLNDSAAKLWAATNSRAVSLRPLGSHAAPDFAKSGQWLGINFETGLGAALLAGGGAGQLVHLATEAGHAAFAPMGDAEKQLASAIAVGTKPVSWERALFETSRQEGSQSQRIVAEILGSFVGDILLSTGTWDGVLLFGRAASILANSENLLAYKKRVEMRANFQLQLRAVPQWAVAGQNLNLVGAACYLTAGNGN